MSYELSKIELELDPMRLKNNEKLFYDVKIVEKHPLYTQVKNDQKELGKLIKEEAYYLIQKKYEELFNTELHVITDSINNHHIKDDDNTFEKYVIVNYKGLLRLGNHKYYFGPRESYIHDPNFHKNYWYYTEENIKHLLESKFVEPLTTYFDNNFSEILINNNLLESPIDFFLDAIEAHNVKLTHHKENIGLYRPTLDNESELYIEAEYNGEYSPSTYNNELNDLYEKFKKNLNYNISNETPTRDKILFIEKIKTEINEIQDNFFAVSDEITVSPENMLYNRTDVAIKIKDELNENQISEDFFHENLFRLIAIQYSFVEKARKYLFSLLRTLNKISDSIVEPEPKSLPSDNQDNSLKNTQIDNNSILQWRGPINKLATIFFDLTNSELHEGSPVLRATNKEIINLLINNFVDKDGQPLSPSTIETYLRPGKTDKRVKENKKYKFNK